MWLPKSRSVDVWQAGAEEYAEEQQRGRLTKSLQKLRMLYHPEHDDMQKLYIQYLHNKHNTN